MRRLKLKAKNQSASRAHTDWKSLKKKSIGKGLKARVEKKPVKVSKKKLVALMKEQATKLTMVDKVGKIEETTINQQKGLGAAQEMEVVVNAVKKMGDSTAADVPAKKMKKPLKKKSILKKTPAKNKKARKKIENEGKECDESDKRKNESSLQVDSKKLKVNEDENILEMNQSASSKVSEKISEHQEASKMHINCYRCGKNGHHITACPELDESEKVPVCFSCGSCEHKSRNCPTPNNEMPFASCLICKEKSHKYNRCPQIMKNHTQGKSLSSKRNVSWSTEQNITCFRCYQQGHKRSECQSTNLSLQAQNKDTCYGCRKVGHKLSECPNINESEKVTVCYICGSTEHFSSKCKNRHQDSWPFATCFVCLKKGHLSARCPLNASGIYVNGGSCNGCGSTQHLYLNCPERTENKGKKEREIEVVASKQDNVGSADSIENIDKKISSPIKKPAVVMFGKNQ